jgi:pyridoxamine 5'-phosphate oxidase
MDRPIHNETPFGLSEAGNDPFDLFAVWFAKAQQADARNAAVTALATASEKSRPSLRMVLLKEHGPTGFVFYTNYESRKSAELAENPFAAMTFWWPALERQVRIEGKTVKISAEESDLYFTTRPRNSQLSAWVFAQSSIIEQPASLDEVKERFGNRNIPRPANWGGYRLTPNLFEFWQGRANRLHDRIRFNQIGPAWQVNRLAP